MTSHGRQGIQRLLLGSKTQDVLTDSALPVLCFGRPRLRQRRHGCRLDRRPPSVDLCEPFSLPTATFVISRDTHARTWTG
ncbi:universal stress protein (plasmid) [Variovorax sp. EBFNA2]|nr:universal stress protein [Variovorax boronicumulans]WPG41653.1 universal stress protein [Variovorax boronicumulans]